MKCKYTLCLTFIAVIVICRGDDEPADAQTSTDISDAGNIVFVIVSQINSFHVQLAEEAKRHLEHQAVQLNLPDVHVVLSHLTWPNEIGIWTIFPLIERIIDKILLDKLSNPHWVLICEEGTRINLNKLISILRDFDHDKEWFLGKALWDSEATIIHHFAFHDNPNSFQYPDSAAGILLSWPLINKLKNRSDYKSFLADLNFSIDPQHELALFIWDEGNGVGLTNSDVFCTEDNEELCATYYVLGKIPICVKPVHLSDIFFAVKTCKKYEERVTVLLQTWAKPELDLTFFGDVANDSHGQNIVNLKVENTNRGHCGKTMGILHYVAKNQRLRSKSWLIITDDDTLMSVSRLRNQLSCYNSMEKIAVGQRYGYRTTNSEGYDYMTGGAGMILSMSTVRHIVESGLCKCPTADTPDDMYLGICLQKLKIPVIHSPYFHQARPTDYSKELLSHQEPVTFHKFWMIDPVLVYNEWLSEEKPRFSQENQHIEL